MTYDDYNQVITYRNSSGRRVYYQYDVKGELLSTTNPDIKESNGRKYDQYGNVIEYSPRVSGRPSLLSNGSFERPGTGGNLLANWEQSGTQASLQGFNSHGNSALKISSTLPTETLFYQTVNSASMEGKITLRADVKLDNVQYSGSSGGVLIKLSYRGGMYTDSWYVWGSGTFPLVLTSQTIGSESPVVYIGLSNASGTVWFDGVQLENGYNLSAFNSVENSSFENGLTNWNYSEGTPTISDIYAWDGDQSLRCYRHDMPGEQKTVYQDVPTYGGEPLTLSGMVKTINVGGTGAYFQIEYYDASSQLIPDTTVQTGYVTGTQEFTMLSCLATAPLDAHHARVTAVLRGEGYAYFDSIKLIPRNTEKCTYNSSGNYIINSEDPLENHNQYSYNENTGTLSSFTDAVNNTTSYTYDSLSRLVQVQDPISNHAYYGYDGASNLIASRDTRSSSSTDDTYLTGFDPNEINQLSNLTDPINKVTTNTYDRAGNLTSVLQPNGMEINYEYDDADYLHQKNLDGGRYFTYTYDGAKNLTEVTDQDDNSDSWDYDGAGRVQYSIDSLGKRYDYQWDRSSNLTKISGTVDSPITYCYDNVSNRLLRIEAPTGTIYYNYDESGRAFQIKYGDYYRNIGYYANGWCSSIQDEGYPGMYPFNYLYYNNGNISSVSSWAGVDSYDYDANGRLIEWNLTPTSGTPTLENYQYDEAGNITTKGGQTFDYDQANRITNNGFTYDDNGNLTSDGIHNYTYNAENQLSEVRQTSNNSLVATYTYDYNGLRKSKTVNGVTTYFHWNAFGNLAAENDTLNNSYAYYYDPSGNPIGFIRNGDANQKYIYHTNQHGDIVSITDSTGTIQTQYSYDPWGTQTSSSGTMVQPLRYAGYYLDSETGLYYLKSRYYSPSIGRFLTKDAYGYVKNESPQTLNLYAYCGNNPISQVDPNGNESGVIIDANEEAYLNGIINNPDSGSGDVAWALDTLANGIWLPGDCTISQGYTSPLTGGMVSKEQYDLDKQNLMNIATGSVGPIEGFTKHGVLQIIGRDGGIGVNNAAILDAVNNPIKIVQQGEGKIKYIGENATVILNKYGEVITSWARNAFGVR